MRKSRSIKVTDVAIIGCRHRRRRDYNRYCEQKEEPRKSCPQPAYPLPVLMHRPPGLYGSITANGMTIEGGGVKRGANVASTDA